jgi:GNAT superfamily N-acetyltransferase
MTVTPALAIRPLRAEDCGLISSAFAAQGWDKPLAQYARYWQEQCEGARLVLVAAHGGEFRGYVTIVWESAYAPFREAAIPEIVDLNVLIAHQRQGVGSALLEAAEQQIALRSPRVGIGFGLTADYGAAQVLYVRRGYVPDGRGAYSHDQPLRYGDHAAVDDGLVLYLVKQL